MTLSREERAEVEAQTSDVWKQQLLIMVAPLFRSDKVEWAIIKKRIIFKRCTLKRDIPASRFKAGDVVERVELVLDDEGWHARVYESKADRYSPLRVFFHAAWGNVVDTSSNCDET